MLRNLGTFPKEVHFLKGISYFFDNRFCKGQKNRDLKFSKQGEVCLKKHKFIKFLKISGKKWGF
jgi:hypothetical protein